MQTNKLARQISFFGEEGQETLSRSKVVIVGVGGVGSHIAQQLSFLDVRSISLVDNDKLEPSNCNRLIGVNNRHPMGTPKVEIIKEHIEDINPDITVIPIDAQVRSARAFEAIKSSDFVFGSVDNDGARLVLNELCLAYSRPFIDAASDILPEDKVYGGHVVSVLDQTQCLYCLGEIDSDEARKYLQDSQASKDEQAIYGVDKKLLNGGGPSVVSLNGIIASIAVTEFLLNITGIRACIPVITYYGDHGIARKSVSHDSSECFYCQKVRGKREKAQVERYIIEK